MLTESKIRELLEALDGELAARNVTGEIGLCGGAVMCLVFKARPSTRDVDAIFEPTREIRKAAAVVGRRCGVPDDWPNDAAKGFFLSDPPRIPVLELRNLRVWAPPPEYMLAMKCVSARFDTHDRRDVEFLIEYLSLEEPEQVFQIVRGYYPRERVPPKARFLVEELFEGPRTDSR